MRRLAAVACAAALTLALAALPTARAAGPSRVQQTIASFDGTPIFSTLFLPQRSGPVPVVLLGAPWSGIGQTSADGHVGVLVRSGYAVMTWDPRGFGRSGGSSSFASPDVEGRDVGALIGWLARHPAVALESPGDPVVGMSGGSYGGAIQLVAAAVDARVDAITPEGTWFDLRYALFPNGVAKLGWNSALWQYGMNRALTDPPEGQPGGLSVEQHRLQFDTLVTDSPSPDTTRWLLDRSLAGYGQRRPVRVPTLVMQAATDAFFDLNEGLRIFRHARANGAPARLVVYCGGHGLCLHPGDDRAHLDAAIVAWFDRFLKGDTTVPLGPPVEYRGTGTAWKPLPDFPPPDGRMVPASGRGSLLTGPTPETRSDSGLRLPLLTAPPTGLELLGVPRATLTATGVGTGGKVALRLIDRETHEIVSNQEIPLRLGTLSGTAQRFVLDLPGVAHTLAAGHHLDLHVVPGSSWYSPSRQAGHAEVRVTVDIPVR